MSRPLEDIVRDLLHAAIEWRGGVFLDSYSSDPAELVLGTAVDEYVQKCKETGVEL